ncbi:MAG: O-antigen ligase family protein [Acidimicrobiia bacterium]
MAATGATLQYPGAQPHAPDGFVAPSPARRARLPYGWPIYALFGGFPLWWFLGLGAFIWPVLAVPMAFSLLTRARLRVPRGFGLYLLFLIWMLASALQINGPDRMIGFAYRSSLYFSAGILCLYVYNAPKRLLPTSTVVKTMLGFWCIVVGGGLLGVLMPTLEFATLAERLVPQRLLANEFVYTLVHPTTAQIQTFLGYDVPRPRAPFVYTNDWGGVFSLLVPFVIAGWNQIRQLGRRNLLKALALVSLVPVIFSLNRVLWVCIVLALIYGSLRFALRGRPGAVQGILAIGIVFLMIFSFGPARQLIEDRVATNHSANARTTLYGEALAGVSEQPFLGYGAPRPSETNPNLPSVGTQGQFWLVLYSHGIPAAVFFVGFLVYSLWRSRRARSPMALWCHVVVLVALAQMLFYGLIPTQLHLIMIAVALAGREMTWPDTKPETKVVAVAPTPPAGGRTQAAYDVPAAVGNGHGSGNGHNYKDGHKNGYKNGNGNGAGHDDGWGWGPSGHRQGGAPA